MRPLRMRVATLAANSAACKGPKGRNASQLNVVPGDIVVITAGDQVPADLRVFEATNLKVAEDSLTGESNPVAKHVDPIPGGKSIGLGDRKNCCYSATNVQAGKGKGIAIATGVEAQIGQINSLVNDAGATKEHTNLEIQLEIFGRRVVSGGPEVKI